MSTQLFVILIMFAVPLGWEFYTLTQEDLLTISRVFKHFGQEWSPFIIYAISALVGHFWIQPPFSAAEYIQEAGEVFIVIWVGWIVFWTFRVRQDLLPLDWVEAYLFINASILVGAFFWTLHGQA